MAGINRSVACNITGRPLRLTSHKVHDTVSHSELYSLKTAVCKGSHPVEAVAGRGEVKWFGRGIKYWIHI